MKNTPLLLLLLFLTACSQAPLSVTRYYVLPETADARITLISGEPEIAIRHVRLPDYLNQRKIIRAQSTDSIEVQENAEWAEKLSDAMPRLLANQLSLIKQQPIEVAPLPAGILMKTLIEVNIEQLLANEKTLTLTASYRLIKENSLQRQNFSQRFALADASTEALVNTYQQALVALAHDIAKHL